MQSAQYWNHKLFSMWNRFISESLLWFVYKTHDLDTFDTFSPICFLSSCLFFLPFSSLLFFYSLLSSLVTATWTIWTGYPRLLTSQLSRMSWGLESKPQASWRHTSHSRTCTSSENFFTVTTGWSLKNLLWCFTWWLNWLSFLSLTHSFDRNSLCTCTAVNCDTVHEGVVRTNDD